MSTQLPEPDINTASHINTRIVGYTAGKVRQYASDETKRLTDALQEMTAERDALKADAERTKLTRIERECLLIGKEIQRAAGELPEGYEIEILVERGYGGVTLNKPNYTQVEFNDTVDGLSHCITQAIDAAMKGTS